MTFSEQMKADVAQIEAALAQYLSRETGEGYDRIFEAAKYSALAGGKRLRPVIVLAFCRLCGGEADKAMPFACALEMIHTYSLIHDDLPCMDDDDLRRGRPTCHKAFDEATAVLAGDGLLTAAFETAAAAKGLDAEAVLRCVRILGREAGMNGMIAGQVLDLGAEHRRISLDALNLLQSLKTGCLLRAACELGCTAAGCTDARTLEAAREYGEKLGLAFQIQDDILDIEGDARTLGKTTGKDARDEKSTFPALLGLEACRALADRLTGEAVAALDGLPGNGFLTELARSLTGRAN
ncbi:polyprenyl synthetase family protein [Agathobaculum sp. NSJ-28]|uniref:Farnesyl diphosphate synthase n=2 Tax=Agathobaculum TaxID=2048137 RepID=A0A923RWB3_9FIRM|nr:MULTISPECIES: farnesyl diphosphate synthase [Butyricicoccaceae]MBC5725907.1 polyprenyl synthetase family protein [Agathobaculum faecis]MCU6789146.1 polyprenyl synthetase family protein [Agathobaculum ammoniilyticum]WOC74326.1 polyprenyl synthetase family protein [Intestinibacillus sp. NTUH-41-i26]SCJ06786.1 Farnesyl diphosphate synthase [uncultured Butyricicoccus sp.]